jgi:uncharacterized protein YijF (DUF1287 family)
MMQLVAIGLALASALPDRGIYPELSGKVSTQVPGGVAAERTWLRVDRARKLVTLYDGDDPVQVYPLRNGGTAAPGGVTLSPEDAEELGRFARAGVRVVEKAPARAEDRDGDGIVDRLDILIGAKKLLHNGAKYIERYVSIAYPGGDVPRTEGVCSDTVIRALRNAGIDLQKEVHEDILRARTSYPMVEKVDPSINHRRVRTLLPWFVRHFETMPKGTRYLPGDIVFFDTFPSKPGPDHLGVVSDRRAENGQPYVINNWTDGATDAEMELLSWVPVTHHFRIKAASTRP